MCPSRTHPIGHVAGTTFSACELRRTPVTTGMCTATVRGRTSTFVALLRRRLAAEPRAHGHGERALLGTRRARSASSSVADVRASVRRMHAGSAFGGRPGPAPRVETWMQWRTRRPGGRASPGRPAQWAVHALGLCRRRLVRREGAGGPGHLLPLPEVHPPPADHDHERNDDKNDGDRDDCAPGATGVTAGLLPRCGRQPGLVHHVHHRCSLRQVGIMPELYRGHRAGGDAASERMRRPVLPPAGRAARPLLAPSLPPTPVTFDQRSACGTLSGQPWSSGWEPRRATDAVGGRCCCDASRGRRHLSVDEQLHEQLSAGLRPTRSGGAGVRAG